MTGVQVVDIRSCPLPGGGECVEIIRRGDAVECSTMIEAPEGKSPMAVACARFLMVRGFHITDGNGVRLRAEEVG